MPTPVTLDALDGNTTPCTLAWDGSVDSVTMSGRSDDSSGPHNCCKSAVHGSESGIQLVGMFRTNCDDVAVTRAALAQGINVSPLSIQYRHGKAQRGLVMGFAAVDANATEKAMIRLRAVLQTCGAG